MPRPVYAPSREFYPDPHAAFAKYRSKARTISIEGSHLVFLRYADVENLMTDKRTRQMEIAESGIAEFPGGALFRLYDNTMLISNNPEHRKRRRPASRAFAHKLIQSWRPRIQEVTAEIIEPLLARRKMDLLKEIASPLPSRMIAEILGAPEEDAPYFSRLVYIVARSLREFAYEEYPEIEAATQELSKYVARLLDERRRETRDDFLTDYLKLVDETEDFSDDETLMQIVALIIGGSDTTRFSLTAMISLLLQHPDQWQALCNAPENLAENTVLEALRYEPAAGSVGRVAIEKIDFDGFSLSPGESFSVSLLSAQRDEEVFASPDAFDIQRTDHPRWSLSFGAGAHRCLGEALARAELEEALTVICKKLPDIQLAAPPPEMEGISGLRSISPLHLKW